ncbi:MAG TPA: D-alanyl-D-alanine carboxypeptidase/D-alanyl-D-alanine-endopeptidase [Flavisolibacter sp.]|nr:D-alanyl-D-alanine carboxypeptidase/D-alanyl-D-alanine-endopeptidase [Flavisolibacter sp.]
MSDKLATVFKAFERDPQLRNGLASLYVVNAKTGAVVFDKNSRVGMAPASTQKIITSASAYEFLGKDFRYKTVFGYSGERNGNSVRGNIIIKPSGDPTLGSWRWNSTKEDAVMERITTAFKTTGITAIGPVTMTDSGWRNETIPDGWIWQDIGNYYGAGAAGLNWRENQYDIILRSGAEIGSRVTVVGTVPEKIYGVVESVATAAAKGTGDNAYVYYSLLSSKALVRGTIPIAEKRFTISAAFPDASKEFINTLTYSLSGVAGVTQMKMDDRAKGETIIHTETSPPLDSIIYYFNKRSINLYGEALVKTIAFQKGRTGGTNEGVVLIKDFWKTKGIEITELNIVDGSGLSPLSRVTTHAQVTVLQHAKKQPWFGGFYYSLPEYNGMRLKSGTIRDVKGFCGYHTGRDGTEYVFSFLVNNYNGAAGSLVQKMYGVLDVLK